MTREEAVKELTEAINELRDALLEREYIPRKRERIEAYYNEQMQALSILASPPQIDGMIKRPVVEVVQIPETGRYFLLTNGKRVGRFDEEFDAQRVSVNLTRALGMDDAKERTP